MTDPVMLPDRRGVKTDKVHMIDWGGQLRPALGGPVQTLFRLGTRSAVDITPPLMRAEPDGRIWAAKLRMAKLYGALAYFRQDGFDTGAPGTPAVDGAGQSGSVLAMKNFTPRYAVKIGQAFSLVHGGQRYLHFAAAQTIVDADGKISLPIFPMLRVIPDDVDVCEVARPIIQGSLSGNEVAWTRMTAPVCDFGTITITEDA